MMLIIQMTAFKKQVSVMNYSFQKVKFYNTTKNNSEDVYIIIVNTDQTETVKIISKYFNKTLVIKYPNLITSHQLRYLKNVKSINQLQLE